MSSLGNLNARVDELKDAMQVVGGASIEEIQEIIDKQTNKIQKALDKEHKHFDKRLDSLESECKSIKKDITSVRYFMEDWRREQLEQKWYDNLESRYLMLKDHCPHVTFEEFKYFLYHTEIYHIESPIPMNELIYVFTKKNK